MAGTHIVDTPIRVSANGRYFVDGSGEPLFWMADTAWPFFAQYSLTEAETYLAARAKQGFNVVKGVLAWPGGTSMEQPTPLPNYRGELPWLDNNPATPNLAYFEHVAHLVRVAVAHNLILNMLPTWGYFVNDNPVFNVENAKAYGLWLGQRFKNSPNVIWTVGGDRIPPGFEDVYRAMAHGLREGDAGAHLITYHPGGLSSSGRFFRQEDWLDFNMIQTWGFWDRIHPMIMTDVLRTPNKPVIMDEGAYEEGPEYPIGPITPLLMRRQAWWTFMAGGFCTYGHTQSWRLDAGWISSLDSPGAADMTQFKQIATSRCWWEMIPCQAMFSDGVSVGKTLNTAIRTADGRTAVIYLSSYCNALVNIYEMASYKVQATWVHPSTGEQRDAGIYGRQSEWWKYDTHWFTTPNVWEDAILILDAL